MSRWPRSVAAVSAASILYLVLSPLSVYAVTPGPIEAQRLYWRGAAAGDMLGGAVTVWGDSMASGCIAGDVGTTPDAGKVLTFDRRGLNWEYGQTLQALVPKAGAGFGSSLAMKSDVLVVGAPFEDAGGATYVFERPAGSWVFRARLSSPITTAGVEFGYSVATDGSRIVVGAPLADGGRGRVYVYDWTGSAASLTQTLTDPEPDANGRLGRSVAMSGDWIVAGCPYKAYGGSADCGAALVYAWNPTLSKFSFAQTVYPPYPENGQRFGDSVALNRDDLVVGAPRRTYGTTASHGLAHWYRRSGSTWALEADLAPTSSLGTGVEFGSAVGLSGSTAAVSAPLYFSGRGLVELFDLTAPSGAVLNEAKALYGPAGLASDAGFGAALGISGGNMACGAPHDDGAAGEWVGSVAAYTFVNQLQPHDFALRVSGSDRYGTSAAASKRGFPMGAPAVVVCTGENWPDALGGAGLAGAAHGPVLLTRAAALPAEIEQEVKRLGAVKAYILGGPGVVSDAVKSRLAALLGSSNVTRIYGANRYTTARQVAAKTIALRGSGYAGLVFVATGDRYPDAVACSPLLAWNGTPLILANPASTSVDLPPEAIYAVVAGGEGAVSVDQFNDLVDKLGATNVVRKDGVNRYETAAALAQLGVDGGMNKNGVGLASGENFPDALSAGPMLGPFGCPLLLTPPTALSPAVDAKLRAWRPSVTFMHVVGGTGAVTSAVASAAANAAWGP
ncbi:MAG: cell wall-binding repeat-containing protein [Coriobacteriia bacterium]|nr:cell wall-binding repeat-containing protein [Coriobacteriia bacterium]